jgi:hypothetical protein
MSTPDRVADTITHKGDNRFAEGHEVLSDLVEHVAAAVHDGDDEPLRDVVNEFAEAGRAAMASAEWWDRQQLRAFLRLVSAGDHETAAAVLDDVLRARVLRALVHIADAVEAAHEQEQE